MYLTTLTLPTSGHERIGKSLLSELVQLKWKKSKVLSRFHSSENLI